MNFGAIITMVGALVNFSLAIFVLLQNPRATTTRIYFVLGTCFAIWNFGTHFMFRVHTAEDALFWARFLQFGVIFIPLTFCHLSFRIARIALPRKLLIAAYAFHIVLWFSNFTGFFLAGVRNVGYAWYSVAGTGFWMLSGVFTLMWVSVGVLLHHRKQQPALMRRRLTPLIIAQASFAIWGCNDILPILGIDYYPLTHFQVYPFGSIAVIFYGMIVGYSVLQHQLLDVHVVMGRYAAHLVRMLFLFLIGLCLLLLAAALAPAEFTVVSFFSALVVMVISALVASLVFPRLLGGSSEQLERRLLGDSFEYQDQVKGFITTLSTYTDSEVLMADLHNVLTRTFRLISYKLLLRNEVTRTFSVAKAYPTPRAELPELRSDAAVLDYFEWRKGDYLSLSREYLLFNSAPSERMAREQLEVYSAEFCFPLLWQDDPLGFLLVGAKTSAEPFTATDIGLLIDLSRSLSMVLNQIRLKTQIMQAQELDLLGRMSRGMAHDLNNLLTPVSTLLQLKEETGVLDDELLPVASRNLGTMRAYISEALFFSENLRPDLQMVRLDLLVKRAAEVARNSRPKVVSVTAITPEEIWAELDGVLIQRLIANLATNAIDASPEGSEIQVVLERSGAIDKDREWLRVRVRDRGEGISREDLKRVFTPYFTTKNRGDRERGFGLGLAICRKIATLHGGDLAIESKVGSGTTVQLDLPSRRSPQQTTPTFTSPLETVSHAA